MFAFKLTPVNQPFLQVKRCIRCFEKHSKNWDGRKILVEVKSFLGRSFINDLEQSVGQYIVYRDILVETALDFELYLAITQGTYKSDFQRKLAQKIINLNQVKLLIIDAESEVIVQWID
ncbi:element excision factor XisH family protein [Scytonema sp. NUACC26]|uniref:element excision factor XisH family protein n=1 Tax=Scytonema sp. NUACC26 TaxID=3140176 RepID=UPI0034DBF75B